MSLQTGLVFVFTILASVSIVAAIILLGKQAPADEHHDILELNFIAPNYITHPEFRYLFL